MKEQLEFKKHGENYEVIVKYGRQKHSAYHNILDRDSNKIAIVLMDLYRQGFPIDEASKKFLQKVEDKDWL